MSERSELIEYLAQIVPDATVECAGCGVNREAGAAVMRDDKWYCSEQCADRSLAPLRKPQPKAVIVDGWKV